MIYVWSFSSSDPHYREYLSQGEKVTGVWIGEAAPKFGLTPGSTVKQEEWEKLIKNQHPISGSRLTKRTNSTRLEHFVDKQGKLCEREVSNRIPVYDVTCSMPKSLSILGLVGGAPWVTEAHHKACEKAFKVFEEHTTCVEKRGYKKSVIRTGKMCAAKFTHYVNRSYSEPQIHSHYACVNATPLDDRNLAVERSEWIDRCALFTAIYRDVLATEAIKNGHEITLDQYGAPQVKLLEDLIPLFSQRSADIEEIVVAAEGIVGSQLTDSERKRLVMQTRGIDLPGFREIWSKERANLEIQCIDSPDSPARRKRLLGAFEAIVRSCSDQEAPEVQSVEELLPGWRDLPDPEQLERLDRIAKIQEPGPPRCVPVIEAVNWAIKHAFEKNSVVKDWVIMKEALRYAMGANLDLDELKQCVATHKGLIHRGDSATTLAHYENECQVIRHVDAGKNKGIRLPKIKDEHLTKHQLEAVNELLKSKEQFVALIGKAGSGKSESLASLIKANVSAGYRVQAVAPSTKSRDVLQHEDKSTLQLFLMNKTLQSNLRRGDLLAVDEAGFCSFKQIRDLMDLAAKNEWRIVFSGDPHQHVSVEAGDGFRITLDRSHIKREWLSSILRQKETALDGCYRRSAKLFSVGKTTEAFATLDRAGAIHVALGMERVDKIADMYLAELLEGRTVAVVNPSHRENDLINQAIRDRLKKQGKLGEERVFQVHRSLGWTEAEREQVRNLKPGFVLEITIGKDKGRIFEVRGVDAKRNVAIGVSADGARFQFDKSSAPVFQVCERREIPIAVGECLVTHAAMRTKKGQVQNGHKFTVTGFTPSGGIISHEGKEIETRNLAHSPAGTSHRSQGDSVDTVIFGMDRKSASWVNQKLAYVAATRGKTRIAIFCESKADLIPIEKRKGDRRSALELIKYCIHLATQQRQQRIGIHQDNPQIRT